MNRKVGPESHSPYPPLSTAPKQSTVRFLWTVNHPERRSVMTRLGQPYPNRAMRVVNTVLNVHRNRTAY